MKRKRPGSFCWGPTCSLLLPRAVKTMLGSLRTCAARRPANLMATSFTRRTKAGSAESVTSSVSLPPDPLTIQRSIGGQFRCSCGWFCMQFYCPAFATVNSSDPTPLPSLLSRQRFALLNWKLCLWYRGKMAYLATIHLTGLSGFPWVSLSLRCFR